MNWEMSMPQSFYRIFAVTGSMLCAGAAGIYLAMGLWPSAAGVFVGGAWLFLNLFMLIRLMEMSVDKRAVRKDRVLVYSVLKFPVLYVAGFFLLKSRVFPVSSILVGLTAVLAAFAAGWLRLNAEARASLGKTGAA